MKKILVLANKDNVIYNFRSELMLALKEKGFDVIFVCPYGKKIDFFINKGFRNIDIKIDRRGTNIIRDIQLIKTYKKIIKNECPDLVLTFTTKPSVYGGYICGKLKVPYIVNNAGLMKTNRLFGIVMSFLYKKGYKKASCMMFQNVEEKEYFLQLLKRKVHYRELPGSGVNLDNFTYCEYPKNETPLIFNFVARIVKIKGIDIYIEAAKIIKNKYKDVEFRIFGDFDDKKYISIINTLSENGTIRYCGVQADMRPWISECHAAIHPSFYEGMTNVILEHGAMGRPSIGSDIPGIREGIDESETGFLFKVGDVNSLVSAIEKFIKLKHYEKKNMGLKARHKMELEFNRKVVTDIYVEEIDKIVKN